MIGNLGTMCLLSCVVGKGRKCRRERGQGGLLSKGGLNGKGWGKARHHIIAPVASEVPHPFSLCRRQVGHESRFDLRVAMLVYVALNKGDDGEADLVGIIQGRGRVRLFHIPAEAPLAA